MAERSRVARDLHDTLLQGLTAVSMQVGSVANKLDRSPETARRQLGVVQEMVRQALDDARRFVWDLREPAPEPDALGLTLERAARRLCNGTDIEVAMTETGPPVRLPRAVQAHLFFAGQEAVMNALKHARARRIELELHNHPHEVRLIVRDDGRGMSADASPGHFGLQGLRERVAQSGGNVAVRSHPGAGVEIEIVVPISSASQSPGGVQHGS
jgi:signal transduction histidine kinase